MHKMPRAPVSTWSDGQSRLGLRAAGELVRTEMSSDPNFLEGTEGGPNSLDDTLPSMMEVDPRARGEPRAPSGVGEARLASSEGSASRFRLRRGSCISVAVSAHLGVPRIEHVTVCGQKAILACEHAVEVKERHAQRELRV